MISNAPSLRGSAVENPAGAELRALLNIAHGIQAIAEETHVTRRDLERLHDLGCSLVKLAAAMLSETQQRQLRL